MLTWRKRAHAPRLKKRREMQVLLKRWDELSPEERERLDKVLRTRVTTVAPAKTGTWRTLLPATAPAW